MFDTDTLYELSTGYLNGCKAAGKEPSFKGLAAALGISDVTIANVYHGRYNGNEYTKQPNARRVVDNQDFHIIREIFI